MTVKDYVYSHFKKEVKKAATLARLELTQAEEDIFTRQLDTIMNYVEKLQHLNAQGVEPTSHVIPLNNVFRKDIVLEPLGQKKALANAPDMADGCFRVPKVVE